MHSQLRRAAMVSTSAAVLLGIAGIQAGIAQAAVDTPAPSPVPISHQSTQPFSMSIVHAGLATPLATSSGAGTHCRSVDEPDSGSGSEGDGPSSDHGSSNRAVNSHYVDGDTPSGVCNPRGRDANDSGNDRGNRRPNGLDESDNTNNSDESNDRSSDQGGMASGSGKHGSGKHGSGKHRHGKGSAHHHTSTDSANR